MSLQEVLGMTYLLVCGNRHPRFLGGTLHRFTDLSPTPLKVNRINFSEVLQAMIQVYPPTPNLLLQPCHRS